MESTVRYIYGRVKREIKASSLGDDVRPFIPFLYQGQYYDFETNLAYNRFRYYSPETGAYISQDPIGLAGGNPTLYGYVKDSNWWVDVFGLLGDEFDIGLHSDLLKAKKDSNLRSHHAGQKAIMKLLVANYDENKAPAILVNYICHNKNNPEKSPGVVSTRNLNPNTGKPFSNARELLARDIRELRRVYSNIPNSKLQELIELNKSMYPEMRKSSQLCKSKK